MAMDPVDWNEDNPSHSFNTYSYANNSPYGVVDPDGQEGGDPASMAAEEAGINSGRASSLGRRAANPALNNPAVQKAMKDGRLTVQEMSKNAFSREMADAITLERVEVTGNRTGRTNGETAHTARGRQAHKNYENTLGDPEYVFDQKLPSGKRPDAINFEKRLCAS